MQNKPTLIEGARGPRGRYELVREVSFEDTPVGTNWLHAAHREVHDAGYDRSRVRIWIDYRQHYLVV